MICDHCEVSPGAVKRAGGGSGGTYLPTSSPISAQRPPTYLPTSPISYRTEVVTAKKNQTQGWLEQGRACPDRGAGSLHFRPWFQRPRSKSLFCAGILSHPATRMRSGSKINNTCHPHATVPECCAQADLPVRCTRRRTRVPPFLMRPANFCLFLTPFGSFEHLPHLLLPHPC